MRFRSLRIDLSTSMQAGSTRFRRLLAGRSVLIIGSFALAVVVVATAAFAYVNASTGATASPSQIALATDTPEPTLSPSPSPTATPIITPTPTPSPTPQMIAATTDGVLLPMSDANIATRKPIAVMIDDHWGARPQSGLSYADIVYQGPAEGGIPRYMAIFQTHAAPAIGPIRSAREYFVAWAEEYRAIYVHIWGAPTAMNKLATDNFRYVYNIDGLHYGRPHMWRTTFRVAPHNLYTSYASIWALAQHLGAKAPLSTPAFTFGDAVPVQSRPSGGMIDIAYDANNVLYSYDPLTNTYPRSVSIIKNGSAEVAQVDASNQQRIAPSNVLLLFMNVGLAGCTPASCHKHRLDVQYVGKGKAMVFNNGQAIVATWSKKSEYSPTVIKYAGGPNAGQQVPLVRGQIFVQVVPTYVPATWRVGPPA